jgi:IclR family pca regulon transcriptional regulator
VEQDVTRKYRLAPRSADIGIAALDALPVRQRSMGILEALRDETGYTVSLGVLDGREVLYVDRARGYGAGQREIDLGVLGLRAGWWLPAHLTSTGKLLLAYLPESEQWERVEQIDLREYGTHAMSTQAVLIEELQRIRNQELALSDRELAEPLLSIAAPVAGVDGTVTAALAVEAHTAAITADGLARQVGLRLMATATRLSESLGRQTQPREQGGAKT